MSTEAHYRQTTTHYSLATLAAAAAAAAAAAHGCSDPAAVNYNPLSPATAAARFNNSGCVYSCGALCTHFNIDCVHALCLIDTGADSNWTTTNATLYATLGTALIVQGRVNDGDLGHTRLRRRVASTSAGGATVILVRRLHTMHSSLTAMKCAR